MGTCSLSSSTKPDTDEDGAAGTATDVATIGTASAGDCPAVPTARRFAQSAWFMTDPDQGPIELKSMGNNPVWIERGLVVYGGEDASTGALLSDLWLFDLTNGGTLDSTVADASSATTSTCRWHLLSEAGNSPLARGSMVYVPDTEEFVVIGGWTEDSTTAWTTNAVSALGLRDIEAGSTTFSALGSGLPDATATWQQDAAQDGSGAVLCQGSYYMEPVFWGAPLCSIYADRCTGCITSSSPASGGSATEAGCSPLVGTCNSTTGAFAACAADIYCTDGVTSRQVTASAPGLAGHAAVYGPADGMIRVFGGASGCDGAACAAWDAVLTDGQEGEITERATLLNDVDLIVDPATGAVSTRTADRSRYTPRSGEWPTPGLTSWPDLASPGVQQLGVALTGLTWDRPTRTWGSSGVSGFAKGGTRYATLAPYQRFEITAGVLDTGDPGQCAYSSSCYQIPGEWVPVYAALDEGDGILSANYGTAEIDLSSTATSYGAHSLSSVSDAVRHGTLVSTDADRLMLVGGRNSSGSTGDVVVMDLTAGTSTVVGDIGNRYGASVMWDPIVRRAYVFGGTSSTDVRVFSYVDDPLLINDGSSFQMGASTVDVQAAATDPMDSWAFSTTFSVTHTCVDAAGGADCLATWLPLTIPLDTGAAGLDTLQITLTFSDGTITTPTVILVEDLAPHRSVSYDLRLPRELEDGESVSVSVSYQTAPDPEAHEAMAPALTDDRPVLQLFEHSTGSLDFLVGSLPAWTGTGEGWKASAQQQVEASFTVNPPTGWSVAGNGILSDPTATTDVVLSGAPAGRPADFTLLLMQDLSFWQRVDASGGTVDVFVDDGIDTTAADWLAMQEYLDTDLVQGSLTGDLSFLASSLGTIPRPPPHLLLLRQELSNDAGIALHGTVVAMLFNDAGTAWRSGVDTDSGAFAVLAHELAHTWLGQAVRFEDDTKWFAEGLAQMIAQSMYDTLWSTGDYSTTETTTWLRNRLRDELATSLPELSVDPDAKAHLAYGVGSYVQLQAYLRYRATGASHAAYWSLIQTWLGGFAWGDSATATDVQTVLSDLTGSSDFTDAWVDGGVATLPMVGLTDFSYDDPTTGAGTATVQQLQREMFPSWDDGAALSGVPYLLACAPVDTTDTPAFDGCIPFDGISIADLTPLEMTTDPTKFPSGISIT